MRDIGHNGVLRSENIQKQAIAEEIQEAMMMKMDIKKQKARKKSKTKEDQETRDRFHEGYWT